MSSKPIEEHNEQLTTMSSTVDPVEDGCSLLLAADQRTAPYSSLYFLTQGMSGKMMLD